MILNLGRFNDVKIRHKTAISSLLFDCEFSKDNTINKKCLIVSILIKIHYQEENITYIMGDKEDFYTNQKSFLTILVRKDFKTQKVNSDILIESRQSKIIPKKTIPNKLLKLFFFNRSSDSSIRTLFMIVKL